MAGSRLENQPDSTIATCADRPAGEVWPNLGNVALPPVYNEMLQTLWLADDGATPADPCDQIEATSVISGMLGSDYYEGFVAALRAKGYAVYLFPYDWRLDVETSAQALAAFVQAHVGDERLILVGHSQGGLVARQYVTDPARAARVAQVISIGTPYWGLAVTARYMREGTVNNPILNAVIDNDVARRFHRNAAAVMQLLPSPAYFQQQGAYFVNDATLLPSWADTFAFFVDGGQNGTLLEAAQQWHAQVDDFQQGLTVPYAVLTANQQDAVGAVREYPCWWGENGVCWEDTVYLAGDGTVPWASARLAGATGDWSGDADVCTFVAGSVSHNHGQLLADDSVITDVLHILAGEAPEFCLASGSPAAAPPPRLQVAVMGAEVVTLDDRTGAAAVEDGTLRRHGAQSVALLPATGAYTIRLEASKQGPLLVRVSLLQATAATAPFQVVARALWLDVPVRSGTALTLQLDGAALGAARLASEGAEGGAPQVLLAPAQVDDASRPQTDLQALRHEGGEIVISLAASDVGSGVYKTEYSLDEGLTWRPYDGLLRLGEADAPALLYARSVDRAGNWEYPARVWAVTR
jgi:pimeloyl-ACP methyl ester carboxylesterase